jgi:hypothetical protein
MAPKVRLWFAGGCQLLGIILMMATPTSHGSHVEYFSDAHGWTLEFWSLVFLAAASILAGISLYKFVVPRQAMPGSGGAGSGR